MSHVDRIAIQGFRGFLDKRELPLAAGKQARSLCIFGDNGTGKSSIGDAVEFFFSEDGLLSHLGKTKTENNAGMTATRHARATDKGIKTEITFTFSDGRGFARSASVSGAASIMAEEMREVLSQAPVPFLMRSHDMKTFVADAKGAERYEILSRWVGLEKLTAVQDALTKMEGKARKWQRASAAKEAQVQALSKLTDRAIKDWNSTAIVSWLNAEFADAGAPQKVANLGDLERTEIEIRALKKDEEDRSGAERYDTIAEVLADLTATDSPFAKVTLVSGKRVAAAKELEETMKRLAASELHDVWTAARDYLSDSEADACPVCARKFDRQTSRQRVLEQLDASLAALSALETAEKQVNMFTLNLRREVRTLDLQLSRLEQEMRDCNDEALKAPLEEIDKVHDYLEPFDGQVAAEAWESKFKTLARRLTRIAAPAIQHCSDEGERLRARISIPYVELLASVKQLIVIREGWNRTDREERAQLEVNEQFKAVADAIRADIRAHVKKVVTALQEDVRAIYGTLRGNDEHVPVVDIVVSEDKKSMRVAISLFGIDGVPPTGYLSDSQLNSLGLALYLAAVRRFNLGLRFILLDDIMSSYDASHRLALVQVLAQYLKDFQVIITTHDQTFFREIRSVIGSKGNWEFMELKPWLLETGVRVEGILAPDEEIDKRLKNGEAPEIVAQLIRGNVEDWLAGICCEGGATVKLKIRKDKSSAPPTMTNLWSAAQELFEEPHRHHSSYQILGGFALLNWPLHAASKEQLPLSLGELKTFWSHFKTFRDDFSSGAQSTTP